MSKAAKNSRSYRTPSKSRTQPARREAFQRRLRYESLEDRRLLSAIPSPFLVADINPVVADPSKGTAAGSSNPIDMINVNGVLYFSADNGTLGRELWKYDPATKVTEQVADIRPGLLTSNTHDLASINGIVYFSAYEMDHGQELWKYTPATAPAKGKPELVRDINPGQLDSNPAGLFNYKDVLYFTADAKWWTYTPATDVIQEIAGVYPTSPLMVFDGKLFFSANDGSTGNELWAYDPATGSAALKANINPEGPGFVGSSNPSYMTGLNGILYFSATELNRGTELWKYDPATSTASLFEDINMGAASSSPSYSTSLGGKLYFTASGDSSNNMSLWQYDPVTKIVQPAGQPTPYPESATSVHAFGGMLYFGNNEKLYRYDPTDKGTTQTVKDFGFSGVRPDYLTQVGDTLYFTANDSTHGTELWGVQVPGSELVVVSPTSGLVTSEAGKTATFTVKLNVQPTDDVTIGLSSSKTTEGTVSPASLTFTPSNWDKPQTVTVTGVDDLVMDGNVAYTIVTAAATSNDPNYDGMSAADVAVTNTDNDVAGITVTPNLVTPNLGLVTTEAGGTATFTVNLNSQPTADVTIGLSSSKTTEGTVSLASLTFTASTWNIPQTVTVTGVDDLIADGDAAYTIVTAPAASADLNYNGKNAADVSVINKVVKIIVSPTSGLVTTEAGGMATFTVKLNTQPTDDVMIGLSSDDLTEGTVLPASLTFTSSNWDKPQTVTVTGVDDQIMDGNVAYTIVTAPATSTDLSYNGMNADDVAVTNTDNDVAGITVTPTSGLVTTEAGGPATFTVKLDTQPTDDVTIGLSSSDTTEGTVLPASLTFTALNWNKPQTVTVTGVHELLADGNVAYTIVTDPATSTDANYNGMDAADVAVINKVAGIIVSPTSGLVTTEAGGTATFTVKLNMQPAANVMIGLSSSDTTEGTVSLASLTFTSSNWNIPQTVKVTGVNEPIADGSVPYTIVTAPATSTDLNYKGMNAADVAVVNTGAGILVSPTSGLVTTEAGGTATFTVTLNTRPVANVTIGLSSSDTTEGTILPTSLTFTASNWNIPQTATVTGVDDPIIDGNVAYTIVTAAATSTDLKYSGANVADVAVTNNDNDVAGIIVSPTSGLVTTEPAVTSPTYPTKTGAGGTATFTVTLNSQPTADVTLGLSSSDLTEGTVSPASLTFKSSDGDWNTPRTVTVTGVNDFVMDGNIAYTIVMAPALSTDANYSGLTRADVSVTNTDTDVAGITVTPNSGLVTTEAGGTATFTVKLNSEPTANVTIILSSSDLTEGTVLPARLTFTSSNWYTPQTAIVTGVDDLIADGNVAYTIVTSAAMSSDAHYNGRNPDDVAVTNNDNDVAGITVTPNLVSPNLVLVTTEAGGTATFTLKLNTQPADDVTIGLLSSDTTEGTVSPASLTFTASYWNIPQTVTVTGVDDLIVDGNVAYMIVTSAAMSKDAHYNGLNVADVVVTNNDNDVAGIIVTPTSGLVTTEAGGTATFTLKLNTQPADDVTIGLLSSDTTEGTVSTASLTFTALNWNKPQTVTVTGVHELLVDGNVAYTIVTDPATSTDLSYNGMNADDVAAINKGAGIIVSPTSGLVTSEAGKTATFTVKLNMQPTDNVTLGLSSSDPTEGTVSTEGTVPLATASLTFTAINWDTPQTVIVTGVDDFVVDGNVAYTIVTAPALSNDANYSGLNADDVTATNTDNDMAGITVSPTSGLVTTEAGGTATFTVKLNTQPTANVTIGLLSSDTTEGTVSPASLTFTASYWNIPQTVTVTGVDDLIVDGNVAYTIVTSAATSTDVNYNGLNAADVAVTNTDNDVAGITVTPTSGLVTTEAGGTATFTVKLNTQPADDVTIGLSSNDTTEGTVLPASLTFTTINWNTPQTVTVTGVDDFVVDGNVAYTIVTAAATSSDANYSGLNAADVAVTNTDNDVAGITVSPTSGLVTTEAGGKDTFTVKLNTQPAANVTIGLLSSDTTEGTVLPASLTFTTINWNMPQTVTVTGVDDLIVDGNVAYTIVTSAATSSDANYNGLNAVDVAVTNTDNDVAGITVSPTSGLVTTEAGATAAFTVKLNTQPAASVAIGLSSSDTTEGMVRPASLIFTSSNWNIPQTATVTGVDDPIIDGNVAYTIVTAAATSSDANYNGLNAADVAVTNIDNDVAGITVTPTSGLVTTEAGGTATFTVTLNTQPAASVTIGLSSSDTTEGTVLPASLIFTTINWNTPQTVTVTGVDDLIVDGNVAYTIVTAAATSSDANYNGLNAADVAVTNIDNDVAGITVTPTSGLVTTEAGGTATFTVTLNTQPASSVTIDLLSSDTTEGTVSSASLTFTSSDWNIPQTVTVTGADDFVVDGNVAYTIVTAAATSSDANYSGLNAADVAVTNNDNDVAGITVTPTSGLVTTEAGGTAIFTVTLNTQPASSVTIGLSSSDTTEGTVLPASLTFTTINWNTPQTVIVTGVDDLIVDGNVAYTIMTAAATSSDPHYNGLNATDVAVTNTDNDVVPKPIPMVPMRPAPWAVVPVAPTISVADVTVQVGTLATRAVFTVTLSAASTKTITMVYGTADGTAKAGIGYTRTTGTLTFSPGQTSQTIPVPIAALKSAGLANQTFSLNLTSAVNGKIGRAAATATIVDAVPVVVVPPPPVVAVIPAISIGSVIVTRPTTGTATVTFVVSLSAASTKSITVNYSTINGTALSGSDYTAAIGKLTFAPGVTSQTITVTILANSAKKTAAAFNMALSVPTNATLKTGQGTCTINNSVFTVLQPAAVNLVLARRLV